MTRTETDVRGVGCAMGQGWLWARAMPLDQLRDLVSAPAGG